MQCQICLDTLSDCVAISPCGHNFCAPCLSHHLAALLSNGQPLACPLRCAPPEQIVINAAVRQLVASHARTARRAARRQQEQQGQQGQEEEEEQQQAEQSEQSEQLQQQRQKFLQRQQQLRHMPSSLETVAESHPSSSGEAAGEASSPLPLPSGSRGEPGSPSGSQAAEARTPAGAPPPAMASPSNSPRLGSSSGGGGGGAASLATPGSQIYWTVVLDSPTRSHSQNSILHSPFESDASQGSFQFSGSLDVGAEDAAAQATALPGAPTLPAGTPLNGQAPAGSQEVAALAGQPTVLAAVALGSPSWQQQQQQGQQQREQQQHAEQQAASGSQELPAAASSGSEPAAVTPPPKDASSAPASSACALDEPAAAGSEPMPMPMPMHPLCPLYDSLLPLETASIKTQQMAHSLQLLEAVSDEGEHRACLRADQCGHFEGLCRLPGCPCCICPANHPLHLAVWCLSALAPAACCLQIPA